MNTSVYLAAPFAYKALVADLAEELERSGYTITSRWFKEHALPYPNLPLDHPLNIIIAQQAAQEDLEDVEAAELCIVITAPEYNTTHGRMVELGYALAVCGEVWIVGEVENVFCTLTGFMFNGALVRRFPTIEAMVKFVHNAQGERV